MTTGPSELQAVLDVLTARHGWIATVLIWIGALRLVCKWFSLHLQFILEDRIARALATATPLDEERVERLMDNRWYLRLVFVIDLLFSIKLPLVVGDPPKQKTEWKNNETI